ncbi:MAG: hypothetical protein SNJ72_09145 [Fimbriimonadales bacterium]
MRIIQTMIAPRWWFNLQEYRRRLMDYSDEEVVDIYFHIHPVRYREHYLCVLQELRRRGIKPQVAERPLPDVRWWLPQWLERCPWLVAKPRRYHLALLVLSGLLSALLTSLALMPIALLVSGLDFRGRLLSVLYLLWMVGAFGYGVLMTYRAGARGKLTLVALLGSGVACWLFTGTPTFQQLWSDLLKPGTTPWVNPLVVF